MSNVAQQPVLEVRGLSKRFSEGGLSVSVLQGVDLSVKAGETLVMTGFEREILLRDERDVVRGALPASQRVKSSRQSTVILITPRLSAP